MIPVIAAAVLVAGFLSGCSRSKSKNEIPKEGECTPSKFSKNYVSNFQLSTAEAERLCQIQDTGNRAELEEKYYECARSLHRMGKVQAANTIFNSMMLHSPDQAMRDLAKQGRKDIINDPEAWKYSPMQHGVVTGYCDFSHLDLDRSFVYFVSPSQDAGPEPSHP
ncbi:MAG TPA: hypothetical protein VJR29_07075 [bacterium]|nr:hypothetical protein [bacterium]